MLGHRFYHSHMRRYVILFGTLFNDLVIERDDASENTIQTLAVPISYGPAMKTLARVEQDPGLDRRAAVILPRMSFEMTSMSYAPERKMSSTQKIYYQSDGDADGVKSVYNPVPYDIVFDLSIMVKNAEDGTRILEQILPFFTPDFTATIEIIPEMNLKQDIPIVLQSVTTEDTYEGDFETRRALIHTLSFVMKTYIYGPVISRSNIIKLANTNILAPEGVNTAIRSANSSVEGVDVQPGLLANGSPTSNSSLSIDKAQIDSDDNYGFVVEITDGS
jgi:hypothetical protein